MKDFVYDDDKSSSNRKKHGIDFLAAQELWLDPDLVEIQANSEDESRFLVIGRIDRKLWSAVITYRGSTTRIISVRRARNTEVAIYES